MRSKRKRELPIPIVDLFAGPGGLGEGFSAFESDRANPIFRVSLSIEKDPCALRTLRLRSFFRQFPRGQVPGDYYAFLQQQLTEKELFDLHPIEATTAESQAWLVELGADNPGRSRVTERIRTSLDDADTWVLIGGPPCQAYSIAGRSRNKGKRGYRIENDVRHSLYEEYLRIVAKLEPPIFVMENVKGLLSATVDDESIFERIRDDLRNPAKALGLRGGHAYRIVSLEPSESTDPLNDGTLEQFVVQMESHGVPQRRHRIILLGIRADIGSVKLPSLQHQPQVPAGLVLSGLPRLRSGLSRVSDNPEAWLLLLRGAVERRWLSGIPRVKGGDAVRRRILEVLGELEAPPNDLGGEFVEGNVDIGYERRWFLDHRIGGACNHATRLHMGKDLHRYLFVACYGEQMGRSPRLAEFPRDLLPRHRNVKAALNGGYFNDRFRVQLATSPATTVTSHMHKDGHYYIHPDPTQCRSLTVREAARLQTFPDNYVFAGSRTMQCIQVGNAVPPLLARQAAGIVLNVLRQAGLTD